MNRKLFYPIWSTAIVITIKPEKNRPLTISYRPIALKCVTCKVVEKIISKCLTWILNKSHLTKVASKNITILLYIFLISNNISSQHFNYEKHFHQSYLIYKRHMTRARDMVSLRDSHQLAHGRLIQFTYNFVQNQTIQVRIGAHYVRLTQ